MKLVRCLLIASQAFVFVACAKSENLPERKKGDYCNITWELENVSVLQGAPSTARMDKEFTFSLNLAYHHNRNTDWKDGKEPTKDKDGELEEENIEYEIKPDNIHVYIGGENEKEYNDSYNFYYMDNKNNQFVIKPQYMVNDVRIVIKATKREQPLALYGIEFSESLDKRIDYERTGEEGKDIEIEFRSVYQNKKVPIKILNHGQEAFPCFEHDELDVTLKVKEGTDRRPGKELPDNIVIRTGAHYAILGIDFERDYYEEGFVCNIVVPTYVIHDHASVAVYGEK